jgi:TRAP transporter TAXI family solute receptor
MALQAILVASLSAVVFAACTGGADHPRTQRLSIATGPTGGVFYPFGGGIAKVITEYLPNTEATAEVTAASIDNLKFLRDGKSDIAFTLSDTLAEAVKGTGAFAQKPVRLRTLAVLYMAYTHIVTLTSSGISRVTDLKGRSVSTGTPGGGGESIAFHILEAAGLNRDTDIRRQGLSPAQAADAIKDGKLDAFFWTGGLPTAAVLDLNHTPGFTLRLLPSEGYVTAMNAAYGSGVYTSAIIPGGTYPDAPDDVGVVGATALLVVPDTMPEALAFDITRLLFEKQKELEAIHPEAANLKLQTATTGSPAPFHPGAERYYREHGVAVR